MMKRLVVAILLLTQLSTTSRATDEAHRGVDQTENVRAVFEEASRTVASLRSRTPEKSPCDFLVTLENETIPIVNQVVLSVLGGNAIPEQEISIPDALKSHARLIVFAGALHCRRELYQYLLDCHRNGPDTRTSLREELEANLSEEIEVIMANLPKVGDPLEFQEPPSLRDQQVRMARLLGSVGRMVYALQPVMPLMGVIQEISRLVLLYSSTTLFAASYAVGGSALAAHGIESLAQYGHVVLAHATDKQSEIFKVVIDSQESEQYPPFDVVMQPFAEVTQQFETIVRAFLISQERE
jgi:hypothetical protein